MSRPPTPPLRVLVVQPAAVLGGAERWLLTMLDHTERLEVTALLLADGPLVGELRRRGIEVEVRPTGARPIDGAGAVRALHHRLTVDAPDVVLANGVKAAAVAVPVAALTGSPVVWAKHDLSFDDSLARPLATLADRVVATDASVATATRRHDVDVVPPPAPDGTPVSRRTARRRLGLPASGLLLGMVGRVVDYKGIDDAVRALTRAEAAGWGLAVVGADDPASPGETERLRALARDLGLSDRVHLTGAVDDAAPLVAAFDALAVLTRPVPGSRTPGAEGFGMTALEAMRAGVPVVAVAGSPPAERLAGRAGVVVPPGDPTAVAAALARLSAPAERRAMAAAGRELSADHPDAASAASTLVRVLAEAARRPGAGLSGPAVSVVTTVRDEAAEIGPFLDRISAELGPEDELVVVDGGSTDGTVATVRAAAAADARIRLVEAPGAGISAGRNLGITAAQHDVVACTDAGCRPAPGWLAALTAPFAEEPAPDLVTGVYRVTSRPGRPWEQAVAVSAYPDPQEARRPTPLVRLSAAAFGRAYAADLPTGRSVAMTRPAWAHAGGFPEHLPTGEDVSFGQAVVATGGRAVLAVDAEVEWAQRETLAANLRMFAGYGHGDGLTGSRLLVGRNVARAVAYPAGLALVARGGTARRLAAAGALAYLGLPLTRAARRHPGVLPLVPAAAALRDVAKAWGCLTGLRQRRRG